MSKSREQINQFLSNLSIENKTVLDVGCQDNLAKDYTQGKPKEYITLDKDPKWKPDLVFDLNEKIITTEKYDIVFCLETLEHVWNPIQAVNNLANWTEKDCYISVPFINPIHDKWDYLRYTDEWFEKVLPRVGFKSVEINRRIATSGLGKLMEFYQAEGLRMSKIRYKAGDGHKLKDIGYFIKASK